MRSAGLLVLTLLLAASSASSIMLDVDARTTDRWGCQSPGVAPMSFTWSVVITGATQPWFGELIDWGAFAYKDCNLGISGLIGSRGGAFEIRSTTASVQGAMHVTLACPAQGRTLAIAFNRGFGPGVLAKEATSFCPVPCAPLICRPDACDTTH